MEFFHEIGNFFYSVIEYFLHVDRHLAALTSAYGWQTYVILFIIIFWETGVVIWPFLPGDSLLFAAGSIAALPESPLSPTTLFLLLAVAAILGDTVNYWIGHYIGPKAFKSDGRFLKKKHLERSAAFYKKYGARTIILARFVPIVRTFAPFVAGIGVMHYRRFITYNVVGAVLWTSLFIGAGYFFGNIPIVQENFSLVILAIIVISCVPVAVEFIRSRREAQKKS